MFKYNFTLRRDENGHLDIDGLKYTWFIAELRNAFGNGDFQVLGPHGWYTTFYGWYILKSKKNGELELTINIAQTEWMSQGSYPIFGGRVKSFSFEANYDIPYYPEHYADADTRILYKIMRAVADAVAGNEDMEIIAIVDNGKHELFGESAEPYPPSAADIVYTLEKIRSEAFKKGGSAIAAYNIVVGALLGNKHNEIKASDLNDAAYDFEAVAQIANSIYTNSALDTLEDEWIDAAIKGIEEDILEPIIKEINEKENNR